MGNNEHETIVGQTRPTLRTGRLILRPFVPEDAPTVQRLAGTEEVASNTLTIPHPYPDGVAEEWIAGQQERFDKGEALNLAVTLIGGGLIGAVGLQLSQRHERGELGYWIGTDWWHNGYCTEAAGALVRFGFARLHLRRIVAHHFSRNPASGAVMRKIGMRHEGTLRQHIKKSDVFQDLEAYGLLREECQ